MLVHHTMHETHAISGQRGSSAARRAVWRCPYLVAQTDTRPAGDTMGSGTAIYATPGLILFEEALRQEPVGDHVSRAACKADAQQDGIRAAMDELQKTTRTAGPNCRRG